MLAASKITLNVPGAPARGCLQQQSFQGIFPDAVDQVSYQTREHQTFVSIVFMHMIDSYISTTRSDIIECDRNSVSVRNCHALVPQVRS